MDEFKKFVYYKGEKTVPQNLSKKQKKIWKKEEARYLAENSKIVKEASASATAAPVKEEPLAISSEAINSEAVSSTTVNEKVTTVTGIVVSDNGKAANPQQEIINKMVDKTPAAKEVPASSVTPRKKYEENYEKIFGKKQLPPPVSPIEPLKPETKMEAKDEQQQESKQQAKQNDNPYEFFLGRINKEKKTCELLVYRQPDQASFIHPIFTERGAKYAIKQLSVVKDYKDLQMIPVSSVDKDELKKHKIVYFEVKDVHNWLLDRMAKTTV